LNLGSNINNRSLYKEIVDQATVDVGGNSIDPKRLEAVLKNYVQQYNILVVDGNEQLALNIKKASDGKQRIAALGVTDATQGKVVYEAQTYIDTTPKAELFAQTKAPNYGNHGVWFVKDTNNPATFNTLAVSPIPNIKGITFSDLYQFQV
jgi:hypothetical protein